MKAATRSLSRHDIGERVLLTVTRYADGRIDLQMGTRGARLRTTVDRIYYSALRTKRMNEVRDRERAARRRLVARKAVAR